jgi:hypothetical protein
MPSEFFSALRQVPEFDRLSGRDLTLLGRLVDARVRGAGVGDAQARVDDA